MKLHRMFPVFALICLVTGPARAQEEAFWPRDIVHNDYVITIFQPQVESFDGTVIGGRAAISIQTPGADAPVFGAVWMEATVLTDRDERMVYVQSLEVTRVHIPEASEEQQLRLGAVLEENMPAWDMSMGLDELLTGLDITEEQKRQAEGLNNEPPVIHVRNKPAVLVLLDGEAEIRPLDDENSRLQRVVNTAFVLLKDGRDFYLYAGAGWMTTRDLAGSWRLATSVPDEITEIGRQLDEAQKKEDEQKRQQLVDAGVEVDDPPSEEDWSGGPPEIIVSTVPAELIVFDGQPSLVPVEGDGLLYVDNTSSDVLLEIEGQNYYVLLSGRWFSSKTLGGPWEYIAPDQLPGGFREISPDSEIADVRAFVAGTEEAEEAVLDSFIPQTATIKRNAPSPEVQYDGTPRFEPIEDTTMSYAVNTGNQIVFADRRYWLCYEGAWYVSQDNRGPWAVATEVPNEIYSIPASNPNYNCTFVKVYNTTPEVVYVGYYPGYTNSYIYGGTVVYGTGWWYRGWYGPVYYYPRVTTFGFRVNWNPWTGWNYGFGWSYGPFFFGVGTGGWGWRAGWGWGGWWGVGGWRAGYRHGYARGYARGYTAGRWHAGNRNVNINNININNNIYNRNVNKDRVASTWGRETASRDRAVAATRERTGSRDMVKPSQRPNNVFADNKGNVYRRNDNGSWDRRESGSWKAAPDMNTPRASDRSTRPDANRGQVDRSTARTASGQPVKAGPTQRTTTTTRGNANQDLNRQYQSRQRSSQRTQSYNRSRGGTRSGGGRGRR